MFSILKSYINVNYNFIFGQLKILLPRLFDQRNFCCAFNLLAVCRSQSIRFAFDDDSGEYLATDGDSVKRFLVKQQNLYTYQNGFSYRAAKLSEVYLLDLIKFVDNDLVVDCGANNGDLLMALESHHFNLKYIAFEPGPLEFTTLRQNIRNHLAVNMALGESTKVVQFYLSEQNADSSIVPTDCDLPSVDIQMISFSDYCRQFLPGSRIKLFKIEAEGYEPEVLEGAKNVLNQIEYIVVDGGFERGPEKAPTLPAVSNFLIGHGYTMIGIGGGRRLVALFKNNEFG